MTSEKKVGITLNVKCTCTVYHYFLYYELGAYRLGAY